MEDEVKRMTARDVPGTDLTDRAGNAGREARSDLGNLGVDAHKVTVSRGAAGESPATTPGRPT